MLSPSALEESSVEIQRLRARIEELEQSELELCKSNEKLQASEDLLHSILAHSPNVILVKDLNHRYVLINGLYEQLFQLEPGWIEGKTDYDLFPTEVCDNCLANDEAVIKFRKSVTYEMQIPQEDGLHTYFENKFPLYDRKGVLYGIGAISTDISALKAAEEILRKQEAELRQSQKMEAVGRLAGGIAHDFNNLLTVIMGYADLMSLELSQDNPLQENVSGINNEAGRAAVLVQQLLAFSRNQVLHPVISNLNTIVGDMDKLLRRVIDENIELSISLDQQLANVRVDRSQIEQVILNLAVNARDAMPEGGKLSIETHNVSLNEEYASQHQYLTPGQYVLLTVSDTGYGISDEIKAQIFEPFFTTKVPGAGTGLGLATVYGIIKQSGGNIEVYSEPDQGTTFKIYLPQVNGQLNSTDTISKQATVVAGGSETILLVEDDPGIRQLTSNVLRNYGYNVLEAGRASEAFQQLHNWDKPIDLIITDVVMPEMSGPKMVQQIKQQYPETPLIYISGYIQGLLTPQDKLKGEVTLLQKPFTLETLLAKVRLVLGQ